MTMTLTIFSLKKISVRPVRWELAQGIKFCLAFHDYQMWKKSNEINTMVAVCHYNGNLGKSENFCYVWMSKISEVLKELEISIFIHAGSYI